MIRVEGLNKRIPGGPKVLSDISFEAQPGEFMAVMGASGSGKSMLLRCLALKEKWDSGSYRVDGTDMLKEVIKGRLKIRREFAFLEEKPYLNPNRTALKNVLIGTMNQTPLWRMVTGMVRNDDYLGAMDMIEKVGLLDKAHAKAGKLSGGERQRIAIARSLVHGAKVILADEPVSGLDPHAAEEMLRSLKDLCRIQGVTVITVLHGGDWAERFADRILGLNGGRLAFNIRGRKLTAQERLQL